MIITSFFCSFVVLFDSQLFAVKAYLDIHRTHNACLSEWLLLYNIFHYYDRAKAIPAMPFSLVVS